MGRDPQVLFDPGPACSRRLIEAVEQWPLHRHWGLAEPTLLRLRASIAPLLIRLSGENLVPVDITTGCLEELETPDVQGGVVIVGLCHLLGLTSEQVEVVHGGDLG